MKIIHTADWHLGQSFHGQERHEEHRAFLDWLLDTLVRREADALLIAGDLFDVVNPSLRAQELLFHFIVTAHERLPDLDTVLIAGNHDSGARIDLPSPLLKRLKAHALGRVHFLADGHLDAERLLVPLSDGGGTTRAWCLALPFLRPAEVTGRGSLPSESDGQQTPSDGDGDRRYVQGIERVHRELIEAARARRRPDQALVAMSHAHLHGAAVSEASERPIVIGGEESIPASLFPADICYVALGHLHRAQRVGEDRIRYSGSPLALDFSEANYPHQVLEVTLAGEHLDAVESIPIPRPVAMHRIGPDTLEAVLTAIDTLPERTTTQRLDTGEGDSDDRNRWGWLEVAVRLEAPMPELRSRIDEALATKAVRLLRLRRDLPQRPEDTAPSGERLEDIGPRALFERTWQERWGAAAPEAVLSDFDRLRQSVVDNDGLDQATGNTHHDTRHPESSQ
ncbi:exonuclease SbcCD subunit D [Halomonas sp. V046]|uniref:exonuclease SbcCD subunit D n=1 Tax=Halomonas sp. V046 TaxID=3459611 RepID=UPI00404493E9